MKAERRHELKQNSLAKNLENAPAFFQQYGSRILLAIILFVLAFVWAHNYSAAKSDKSKAAAEALGTASYALSRLQGMPFESPEQMANERRDFAHDAELSIKEALKSDDALLRAEALLVQGNLNWTLANLPPMPAATTRPDLKPEKTDDEYLNAAADAYNKVLQTAPADASHARVGAKLGLAGIAENRSQWTDAGKYYQQVVDDASVVAGFKDYAKVRLEGLKLLEKPLYLGSLAESPHAPLPTPPPVLGPRRPSSDIPPVAPSTQPTATHPAATQPATTQPLK